MLRKRDIYDWVLMLMIFKIFLDAYSWIGLLACMAVALILNSVNNAIDEKQKKRLK